MTFLHRSRPAPGSLAILAGAFNPPTTAHFALAEAALEVVDEVLLALPRTFPHKNYHGASLEQRLHMLETIARSRPGFSAALVEGGLLAEIAGEARPHYPGVEIHLVCGRDTAERILTWDYGDPQFVDRMLEQFGLLVAPRQGEFVPEERFQRAVRQLQPKGNFDECSSTLLREIRRAGGDWRPFVPDCIADLVDEIYR